jgi:hypothetical protein
MGARPDLGSPGDYSAGGGVDDLCRARLRRGLSANHQTLAMVPATPTAATNGFTNLRPLLTPETLPAERRATLPVDGPGRRSALGGEKDVLDV